MNKKVIKLSLLVILIMVIIILGPNLFMGKGTFEELIFHRLSDKDFELVDITKKHMDSNLREQAYIKDVMEIEQLTSMLGRLDLTEKKSIPKRYRESIEIKYHIDIVGSSQTYIYISLYEPSEYLTIGIKNNDYNKDKIYKIRNGNINLTLLDELISNNQ